LDLKVQALLTTNYSLIRMVQTVLCKIAYTVLSDETETYTDTHREMANRAIQEGTNIAVILMPILVTQPDIQALMTVDGLGEVDIIGAEGSEKEANEALFGDEIVAIWLSLDDTV